MKIKQLVAASAVTATLAAGAVIGIAGPASAHTYQWSADCQTGVDVSLTYYHDVIPGKDAVPPVYHDWTETVHVPASGGDPTVQIPNPDYRPAVPAQQGVYEKWVWTAPHGDPTVAPPAEGWHDVGVTSDMKGLLSDRIQHFGSDRGGQWFYFVTITAPVDAQPEHGTPTITVSNPAYVPAHDEQVPHHDLVTPGQDAVPAQSNHVTLTDNGATLVDQDFGTTYTGSFPNSDKTIGHDYVLTVTSVDGIGAGSWTKHVNACEVPPPVITKDAAAAITVVPATCEADGSATLGDHPFADLEGELDTSVGAHTAIFDAQQNHEFADGSTTLSVDYTVPSKLTDVSCYPPQTCTASGDAYTEDGLPQSTPAGDLYQGGSGHAIDKYFPANGNLQGFTGQSLTFTDVAGYQPSVTIVFYRNGTSGYANLVSEWYMNGGSAGQSGTFTAGPTSLWWTNKIASGAGSQSDPQPLAFFSALWPSNQLISVGAHLGSTADADTHSTITSMSGCANGDFVPPVVIPKDATANVTVTAPTCDKDGVPSVSGVEFATLENKLDETPGDHVAVFQADEGHQFADGSTELSVSYTVKAKTGDCPVTTPTPTPTPTQTAPATGSSTSNTSTPAPLASTSEDTLAHTGSVVNAGGPLTLAGILVALGIIAAAAAAEARRRRTAQATQSSDE